MGAARYKAEGVRAARRSTERVRRLADRMAYPAFLAGMGGAVVSGATRAGPVGWVALAGLVMCILSLWLGGRGPGRVSEGEGAQVDVEIDEDTLRITSSEGTTGVPLSEIEGGFADAEGRAVVRLRNGTEHVITLADATQTRALLDALGVSAAERALPLPIKSGASRVASILRGMAGLRGQVGGAWVAFWGVALPTLLGGGLGAAIYDARHGVPRASISVAFAGALAVAAALGAFGLIRFLQRRSVTVGTDGLAVHGTLRTRFVPYASVESVTEDDGEVRLWRKGGKHEVLRIAPGGETLHARITEAMQAHGGEGSQATLERLDRNGRSAEVWREDLQKLATRGEGAYRDATLSVDGLTQVVGNRDAHPERRVAAAVMLAAMKDEGARKRVRVAIDGCADDDLRAALEQAAEGEIAEDELLRAERKAEVP